MGSPMRPLPRHRFEEEVLPILRKNAQAPARTGPDVSACAGFGLNSSANQREFADKFKKVQKDWPNLTAAQRTTRLETLANEQLAKTGVPKMKLRSVALNSGADSCSGHSYGYFAPRDWNMTLASEDLSHAHLQGQDAGEVADTLYHESRHAEQDYLVARLEAANLQNSGLTPQQQIDAIARKTGVKRSVAAAAQKRPLPANAPEHACAEALDKESVQNQNQTNQIEEAVSTAGAAYCKARQQREKAEATLHHAQQLKSPPGRLHSLEAAVQSAKQAEAKAFAVRDKAFQAYEDLFIETDSRATAAPVHHTIDPGWQP